MAANHTYGSAIFSHFLDQHYGPHLEPLIREELGQYSPDLIALRARSHLNRLIWEELKERKSVDLDHFDRVIRQVEPGGLGVVMGEFAVWNYFTNNRYRGEYYAEGDKYPDRPHPRHHRRRRNSRPRHQPSRCHRQRLSAP